MFSKKDYFCDVCLLSYKRFESHNCNEVCRRCKTTVCSKEVNDEVGCLVCLRRFFGRICYEKHLVVKQCREVRL